jgi:TAT-translocated FGD2 family F420-dependent dehydrogenase
MSGEQFPPDQLVEYGGAAEKAGFDIAWASDHFQPWQDNEGHSSFAWATLAAVTQRTSEMILGTGVTCPTYRYHPSIVAEAFATLGVLAPGRVFLGVGTGEALNEEASGAGWGPYAERAAKLSEALEIIRALWTGEWVSYQGQHWTIEKAKLYTLPAQPVPIWVAGNGPQSARLAGLHGDGWITTTKALQEPGVREAFEQGAREAGRDPGELEIVLESFAVAGSEEEAREGAQLWRFLNKAWEPGFLTNPDPEDIQRRAEEQVPLDEAYKEWPVGTDPEVHLKALNKLFEMGATTVFVHSPQKDQKAFIAWYGKNVLARWGKAAQPA